MKYVEGQCVSIGGKKLLMDDPESFAKVKKQAIALQKADGVKERKYSVLTHDGKPTDRSFWVNTDLVDAKAEG